MTNFISCRKILKRVLNSFSVGSQISNLRGKGEDVPVAVRIAGDISVCVPDSLNVMTTYILLEQEDWFEDEIKFVRKLLKPSMNVIDIGANYGVYTLSMAQAITPSGKIWAFEPASKTVEFLNASLVLNKLNHVQIINAALSNFNGDGVLGVERNSELNHLVNGAVSEVDAVRELVQVCSMDHCESVYNWKEIDFIKLDAEGAECNILKGGKHFFATHSPLILGEFKTDSFNLPLVQAFADIGYSPYYLVPGLQILAPFNPDGAIEPFLLNLFFCKPDRARRLEEQGLLTTVWERTVPNTLRGKWMDWLLKFPYGRRFLDKYSPVPQQDKLPDVIEYEGALDLYELACQQRQSPSIRYAALHQALAVLSNLIKTHPTLPRFLSLARMYADIGLRSQSLNILQHIREMKVDLTVPDEPFLAISERFDTIDCKNKWQKWVRASVLDQWEILSHYSGYFTGMASMQNLQAIRQLGFCKQDIKNRIQLLNKR